MFGLKDKTTGKLLGVSTASREGDVEHNLDKHEDAPWLVKTRKIAEKASITNTAWHSRGYETPGNYYVGNLKVVEVTILLKGE